MAHLIPEKVLVPVDYFVSKMIKKTFT